MLLPSTMMVRAQDDPTLLMVGETAVKRSEFVQAYSKICGARVGAPCKVDDFLESYINYKLRVKAARESCLDTTSMFKSMLAACATNSLPASTTANASGNLTGEDLRRIAQSSGNGINNEVVCLSHIYLKVRQRGQRYELQQAIKRADSIYNALRQGADFAVLARQVSQDKASAANGGLMGWYGRNQLLKEMEDNAFTLQPGTYSRPFLTADGYHILLLNDRRTADKFAELQQWQAAEQKRLSMVRGISSSPIQASLPSAERESNMGNSPISPMATASLPTVSDDIYEGLLLCVLSEKSLARQAATDKTAMARYFKKNKKKYRRKGFKPKSYVEVEEQVVADLCTEMEKHWISDLKEKYPVTINKDVLKTINKHHRI